MNEQTEMKLHFVSRDLLIMVQTNLCNYWISDNLVGIK